MDGKVRKEWCNEKGHIYMEDRQSLWKIKHSTKIQTKSTQQTHGVAFYALIFVICGSRTAWTMLRAEVKSDKAALQRVVVPRFGAEDANETEDVIELVDYRRSSEKPASLSTTVLGRLVDDNDEVDVDAAAAVLD